MLSEKLVLDSDKEDFIVAPPDTLDLEDLVANLRDQDRNEILGLDKDVEFTIPESVKNSEFVLAVNQKSTGDLISIFGVGNHSEEIGIPWMLGTKLFDKYHRSFVRYGPEWLKYLLKDYKLGINWISEENKRSYRWLNSIGATFIDNEWNPAIPSGYLQFVIEGGKSENV